MCNVCEPTSPDPVNERRNFLRLATVGTGALMLAGVLPGPMAQASPAPAVLPKPQNKLPPSLALARLMEGNTRYMDGTAPRHDFMAERQTSVLGQNPFAAILACSDSRVSPEYTFDTGLGDLFEVRVAGNFVDNDGLASLEYAVAVLNTPLIMVLGHDNCGAVTAGVEAVRDNKQFPGQIQSLADAIRPSVTTVLQASGDLLANAIEQNVKDTVAQLKVSSSLLTDALGQGKLAIVGGIYRLQSGQVELVV